MITFLWVSESNHSKESLLDVSLETNKQQQLLSRAPRIRKQETNPPQKRLLSNHLFVDLFELVASHFTGSGDTLPSPC